MQKKVCINNVLTIPATGKRVVIFTDDPTKLSKFNEHILDGKKTGYEDVTLLAKSYDDETGLFWMSKPYLAILGNSLIQVYSFTERPESIVVDAEAGEIENLTVTVPNGLVYYHEIPHANPLRDSNSDDIPDCLSEAVEGSIPSLMRGRAFNFDWQIKYALSKSFIQNDFITEQEYDGIYPFAVSGGNQVFDSNGDLLTKEESVQVGEGTVDIYDVSSFSEVRVRDNPGNNAGDVTVWDTVTAGNTDESTWIRIYNTDHIYLGDCVVSNDLIRVKLNESDSKIYQYIEGITATVMHTGGTFTSYTVDVLTTDRVHVSVVSASDRSFTIKRGSIFFDANDTYYPHNINGIGQRFWITSNGNLYDARLLDSTVTVSDDAYWALAYDPSFTFCYVFANYEGQARASWYTTGSKEWSGLYSTSRSAAIGLLPYGQQMYWEAESVTRHSSTTLYTGTDASPFTGNTGVESPNNGYIQMDMDDAFQKGAGKYIIFTRVYSPADGAHVNIGIEYTSGGGLIINQATLVTGWQIVMSELDIPAGYITPNYKLRARSQYSEGHLVFDYVSIIPIDFIEKYTKRTLTDVSSTSSILKLFR